MLHLLDSVQNRMTIFILSFFSIFYCAIFDDLI